MNQCVVDVISPDPNRPDPVPFPEPNPSPDPSPDPFPPEPFLVRSRHNRSDRPFLNCERADSETSRCRTAYADRLETLPVAAFRIS